LHSLYRGGRVTCQPFFHPYGWLDGGWIPLLYIFMPYWRLDIAHITYMWDINDRFIHFLYSVR
jgi:hypothetical protein